MLISATDDIFRAKIAWGSLYTIPTFFFLFPPRPCFDFSLVFGSKQVYEKCYMKNIVLFSIPHPRGISALIFFPTVMMRQIGDAVKKEERGRERICMFIRENLSAFLRTELLLKMPPQQLKLKIIKTLQLFLNGCHAYTFLIWFGIQFTKYTNFSLRCNQLKSCQNLVLVPVTFPIIIYKFLFYLEIEYFDTLITSLYSHTRW